MPDRDLDDLLAGMVSMIEKLESRIADLERQEIPGGSGTNVSLLAEDGLQLLTESGDPLYQE
ncbi:MAG: hypothetical protein MUO64_14715 [Anaerolineales bacterium]|nr:hypothetical protein [Anaerolineales bacterium]